VLPSSADIFVEAITSAGDEDRVGWWNDVYSFDMSDLKPLLTKDAQVQLAEPEDVVTQRCLVHSMDLCKASDADLDFKVPFSLTCNRQGGASIKAFVVSFDTGFGGPGMANPPIVLSTGVQVCMYSRQPPTGTEVNSFILSSLSPLHFLP
jgi:hypothetical protein